ncbi:MULTISPECIES: TonB-dependent receptor [Gammaproteobacteria]|uniref:TonB-dependent receptor n=1 Tax=Gammaproteobacteria TaxID=1236 RepID=UPI000DCF760D|nr:MULTISPECIES: TonB-dependent receptor [Gammaproteobacteria]RTE85752.1 hypothetical protein DQX04_09890 [Aliidiomarina sp. B3213]TCZ90246.1 hypothetical protein EYQ95_10565 [Lysobacter sp. N42]
MSKKNLVFPLSLIALAVAGVHSVSAEEATEEETTIERIEVVGDFRARGIEDVPASVSVLNGEDIQQRQAAHIEDILAMAANVNVASGASRGRFFQIRGIGERSQFVDPINPSVGLVIDGINYSGLGAAGTTFDIGQVEVFRGPQSTRFGADGMAGVIYLSSTPATIYNDGVVDMEWGEYNTYGAGLAFNQTLSDTGVARLSVYQYESDGFMENVFLDREDTQHRDETTIRLNAEWELNSQWTTKLTLHHFDVDNGYDAFSLDLNRETLSDTPGEDTLKSTAGRFLAAYASEQGYIAELSGSFLTADELYGYDEDWAYEGIRPGWEYNSYDEYDRARTQQELEVRVLSDEAWLASGVEVDWLVGAYLQSREQELTRNYTYLSGPFSSQYDTQNIAVYGELSAQLSERLRGTIGGRFESYDNDYSDSRNITASPDSNAWGGRASLEFQWTDTTQWFTTLARGFKTGGVNGEALGRVEDENLTEFRDFLASKAEYDPEYLTSLEFGLRYFSAEQSLRAEFVGFYSWRDDMQVNAYVERSAVFVTYRDNASSGVNYGLEASVEWVPTDKLRLFASAGLLQTELDGLLLQDGTNLTGREQAHAPTYQAHAGFDYALTSNMTWRFEVDAKDAFYYSNSHDERSDEFQLLHTRIDYDWGNWTFSLFARNLTDETYTTRGFYFGNDPRDEYQAKNYVQYGEPRRIGIGARLHF